MSFVSFGDAFLCSFFGKVGGNKCRLQKSPYRRAAIIWRLYFNSSHQTDTSSPQHHGWCPRVSASNTTKSSIPPCSNMKALRAWIVCNYLKSKTFWARKPCLDFPFSCLDFSAANINFFTQKTQKYWNACELSQRSKSKSSNMSKNVWNRFAIDFDGKDTTLGKL